MPDQKKEGGIWSQVIVSVLIALVAGSTSPWWWGKAFGGDQPTPPTATSSSEQSLTGVWESNAVGGGTFYIRQDGSKIWWYGDGPGWGVVLKGTLTGNKILAEWADVPTKGNRYSGKSTIYIITSTKLQVIHDGEPEFYLNRK